MHTSHNANKNFLKLVRYLFSDFLFSFYKELSLIKNFIPLWAQFKNIVMESKSLSNVKDLYYIKKNLVKGEEYFTTSKSVILGAHILYLIIAGILIYSYYSKGISLTTYSLHLLILLIAVIAFYLILSFAL